MLKHILDELSPQYNAKAELPELYKLTSKALYLSAEQYGDVIYKQILGSCVGLIQGLGELRNKVGDAHGKGKNSTFIPSEIDAELAVNLSGSMCLFLLKRYEQIKVG